MSIHKALAEFHKKFTGSKKTGVNPHFGSLHFTLDDIVRATTPILNECGLYVSHQVENGCLVTYVRDVEGDSISSAIPLVASNNPQVTGQNLTYFKRYNLCGLFNIAEEDDDGNAGAAASQQPAVKEAVGKATEKQWNDLKKLAVNSVSRTGFLDRWKDAGLTESDAISLITTWSEHDEKQHD